MLSFDFLSHDNPISCAELFDLTIRAHVNDQPEVAAQLLTTYLGEWGRACEEQETPCRLLTPEKAEQTYYERACRHWQTLHGASLAPDWQARLDEVRGTGDLPFGSWWDVEWAAKRQVPLALVQRICDYEFGQMKARARAWVELEAELLANSRKEGGPK